MQIRNPLLNFDRYSIWCKTADELAAIKEAIQKRKVEIEAAETEKRGTNDLKISGEINYLQELAFDYKQIAIYSAFFERDQKEALKYAGKYHAMTNTPYTTVLDAFEHGVACNLLGNADLMTGGSSSETYFTHALGIFKTLETVNPEEFAKHMQDPIFCVQWLVNKGFALKYMGLAKHRQAMYAKGVSGEVLTSLHEEALKYYEAADEAFDQAHYLQQDKKLPKEIRLPILVDTMEIQHLKGVRYKEFKLFDYAKFYLENAWAQEKEFNRVYKTTHFLTYITQQSLGELYILLQDYNTSLGILSQTLEQQVADNKGNRVHADIAKTLSFIGQANAAKGEFTKANEAYHESLSIKHKLLKPGDRMILVSQANLIDVYDKWFVYDWNDSQTLQRNTLDEIKEFSAHVDLVHATPNDQLSKDKYRSLNYKLGTYYIHALGDYESALRYLTIPEFNIEDELSVWARSQLIVCYKEQIVALNKKIKDAEQSAIHDGNLDGYCNELTTVINEAFKCTDFTIKLLITVMLTSTVGTKEDYLALTAFIYSARGQLYIALDDLNKGIPDLEYSLNKNLGGDYALKVNKQLEELREGVEQTNAIYASAPAAVAITVANVPGTMFATSSMPVVAPTVTRTSALQP